MNKPKPEPTITGAHSWVHSDGRQRKYFEVTDINCLTCNPHGARENGFFAVLATADNTTSLECLNCGESALIAQTDLDGRKAAAQMGLELPHPFRR